MFFWTETRLTRVRITPKNTEVHGGFCTNLTNLTNGFMYGTRGNDGSSFYTDTLSTRILFFNEHGKAQRTRMLFCPVRISRISRMVLCTEQHGRLSEHLIATFIVFGYYPN